jgi:hypothetical protein
MFGQVHCFQIKSSLLCARSRDLSKFLSWHFECNVSKQRCQIYEFKAASGHCSSSLDITGIAFMVLQTKYSTKSDAKWHYYSSRVINNQRILQRHQLKRKIYVGRAGVRLTNQIFLAWSAKLRESALNG